VGESVKPGITTYELDKIAYGYIKKQNAQPNFLHYNGFPASACISINDEVIHGIPSKKRVLQEGDIVSVDLGAVSGGYNGDNAKTFAVGEISEDAKKLLSVTQNCLSAGISAFQKGARTGDIGFAVQQIAELAGFSVVRQFVGHGVGTALHEDPSVPNYGTQGRGTRLLPGMVLAIEPMVNMGVYEVFTKADGWTVKTKDGKLSAHFEHTSVLTENGPVILTVPG
jgi:methionyl aminopeptidase